MRERLADGANKKSDSVEKALQKMAFERFTHVTVQPLHLAAGFEYEDLQDSCRLVGTLFRKLIVGRPLLTEHTDMAPLATAMFTQLPAERTVDEAVLFAGHGSRHPSTAQLTAFGDALRACDTMAFTATMKGGTALAEAIPAIKAAGARKVWLQPLLAVPGRHILNDIGGTKPDSWRSIIEAAGLTCVPILRGLVEYPPFADMWADNVAESIASLDSPSC
jgi:sirohydrochlorin cobaltochelatase